MDTLTVKMTKGDEEKFVHPGSVENHRNAGWSVAEESSPVAVETSGPLTPDEEIVSVGGETIVAVEAETDGEPERVANIEEAVSLAQHTSVADKGE